MVRRDRRTARGVSRPLPAALGLSNAVAQVASLRRSPAEPPGGDEQRGEGTAEPDRLDDERPKVLIAAEVHGGADDADGGTGGQEAADEGVERRQQRPAPGRRRWLARRSRSASHGTSGPAHSPAAGTS